MRIDLYGKVKMNDYRCRSGGNRGWNTRTYTYID